MNKKLILFSLLALLALSGCDGSSWSKTIKVPEDFEDAPEYAGSRIVYNITMKKVEQPNVPMITDAYVQEYFSCNTVAEKQTVYSKMIFRKRLTNRLKMPRKKQFLQSFKQNCEITGYPEAYLSSKQSELETSIKFYALMQGLSMMSIARNLLVFHLRNT